MSRPEKEETILFDGVLYRIGDIVAIEKTGTFRRNVIGKIACIDTLEFVLDRSGKYRSSLIKIRYDETLSIRYAEETDNDE